jgi:hypothetical protein
MGGPGPPEMDDTDVVISGFQINGSVIATFKNGEELLTSGVYELLEVGPDLVEINLGDSQVAMVRIESRNDDPIHVGKIAGQKRIYWSGRLVELHKK